MTICHVISMPDMGQMGAITRHIYDECEGWHIWCNVWEKPPAADIYILHCFKNQKHFPSFIMWQKPNKSKVISVIHSSEPCMPAQCSDVVVTITKAWQQRMKWLYNIDSLMIYGGINVDKYAGAQIDYTKKVFGKITRPEPGKYHKCWNQIVTNMIERHGATCRIVSNGYQRINHLEHDNMVWIEGLKINDDEMRIKELEKMSVYTECHDDGGNAFIDTFCVAVLEAMAAGLPVIIYKGLQEAMAEVIGDAGIVCENIEDYERHLEWILQDEVSKRKYGLASLERAQYFHKDKMIKEWNRLLQGV